ncbi:dynein intermediate chain 3, ciliary [Bacillus rossius redtenbacheri]|uniref:dynein intermediate chain 3, ciliary n=1 Tax=Bacillus rossius redtenbacheri TaxID=93214 RepID=UPI002FDCB2F0
MDTVGNIQYVYQKKRSKFGRPFLLHDEVPNTLNIFPDKSLFDDYILKNPVEQASQCGPVFARCEVNTVRAEYTQHGMNHTEGGWPRDVNPADEEQAIRYRKKVEKDDMYLHALSQLSHSMEHYILQNNALNLYEVYFEDVEETAVPERGSARTVNVYRDPSSVKRPVTYLSWSPDGGSKVAVTHCNLEFQRAPADLSTHSYIWDVENPNKPQMTLKPTVPLASLEYNPKDPNVLVSGMFSGQVAFWDTRRLPSPAEVSALEPSHRDPVHSVLWLSSKSGTEFFSATTDGLVKWWDTRKISEPSETLILDVVKAGEEQDLSRAVGASVLEYEPTIPIRFMVGTENGSVISCNRKGKTPAEKMIAKYSAHVGPVYALQRNPSFVKNFLTIGDWTARIWSEDCKDSAIMWTSNHRHRLTYGAWSPVRTSVFYTTRTDGSLDVWDILQQQREALLTFKMCDQPLKCLRVHENGQLIAVGSSTGTTYLVEVSDNFVTSQRNDRSLLTAMLDRESRREKILEARTREIRLRQRARADMAAKALQQAAAAPDDAPHRRESIVQEVEKTTADEFMAMVQEELLSLQGQTQPEGPDHPDEQSAQGEARTAGD